MMKGGRRLGFDPIEIEPAARRPRFDCCPQQLKSWGTVESGVSEGPGEARPEDSCSAHESFRSSTHAATINGHYPWEQGADK